MALPYFTRLNVYSVSHVTIFDDLSTFMSLYFMYTQRQEDPFALSPFRGGMMMPFGPSPFSMMNGMMMNMDSMMSNMVRRRLQIDTLFLGDGHIFRSKLHITPSEMRTPL